MSGQFLQLAGMRLAAVKNRARALDRDAAVKTGVVILGMGSIAFLAFGVASLSFRFIEAFPAIGPPLNERLLALFLLVLLVMVVLSTAVIAYATLYLAAETEYLFQLPLPPALILHLKLFESVGLSSWATLLLGLPVLTAFGRVRSAPPLFYLEAGVAMLVFLTFCGCAGAAVTLFLLEIVRRWTWRRLVVAGAALLAPPAWLFFSSFDFGSLGGQENLQVLDRFARGLTTLSSPFFPGRWAAAMVVAAAGGHHHEALFQGGVLLANTLIWIPIFTTYGRLRYGSSWLGARDPAGGGRGGVRARNARARRTMAPDDGPIGALVRKDLRTFSRDPAQLTQFLLFVLLLSVYVVSLLQIPHELFGGGWRLAVYFANLGAVALILSSFTSRFLFPLLSLEGKSFWIVGLAPIPRASLVRQKAILGATVILALGLVASLSSNLFLGFRGGLLAGAIYITVLAGTCLTALAAGLGAAYPSLSEDNPARIAVGLGGTLNFFASAAAVAGLICIEGAPYLLPWPGPQVGAPVAHVAAFIFCVLVSGYALRLGCRRLERMEL